MAQISLVITHYCKLHFLIPLLDYLIESIPIATVLNTEIIVVDNLSEDSEKLKHFVETSEYFSKEKIKVKLLFLDRNYGPSYARNRGAEIAKGDYLQFLDEDDWINPSKLHQQYKFVQSQGFPSFVASLWARVSFSSTWHDWNLISLHTPNFRAPAILTLIQSDGFVPLMSGLLKRSSFLEIGGFKEDMWLVEDVRLLIDLYQKEPHFEVCPSEVPLFFYRCGQPTSLSVGSDRIKFYDACYNNAVYVEQLLREEELQLSGESLTALADIYGQFARFYFEHDRVKFHQVLAKLHALNPNYLPSNPAPLRQLSKWFGYERAEAIALKYRQARKLLQA